MANSDLTPDDVAALNQIMGRYGLDAARVRATASQAAEVAPDQYAEQIRTAQRLGVPVGWVTTNPKQAKADDTARAVAAAADKVPALAKRYTDEEFARLASDEPGVLTKLADAVKYMVSAPGAPRGGLAGDAGKVGGAALAGLQNASAGVVGVAQAPLDLANQVLPGAPLTGAVDWLTKYRKGIEAQAKANTPQTDGNLEAGFFSGVQSLATNLAGLPLAFAGPAGAQAYLAQMALPVAGQGYAQARDQGVAPLPAAVFGASQGAIEAGTEMMSVGPLLKLMKPGSFAKKAGEYLLKEQGGEQLATFFQDMNEWAALPENKDKTLADFAAERPDAAIQTAIATLVGGGGTVAVVKGVSKVAEVLQRATAQADQGAAALTEAFTVAAESKLRERSPEQFRAVLNDMGEGTVVRFDARNLVDVLAQSGMTPEQIDQALPSVRAQLTEAAATGGEVSIPVGEFIGGTVDTPLQDKLAEHARIGENEMSAAEAKDAAGKAEQYLQQEAERVITQATEQERTRSESEQVYQTVLDALNTAGRTGKGANEAYAKLHQAFFTAMAGRVGVTPMELFKQFDLKVRGETPGGAGYEQILPDHETLYRGEGGDSGGGNYYTADPEFARNFTRSGMDREIRRALVKSSDIFTPQELPFAGDETAIDAAIAEATAQGKKAIRVSEGEGQPPSTFVFDKTALRPSGRYTPDTLAQSDTSTPQTETPEFKRWFGDSKVVDGSGKPLVVYHGTTRGGFDTFAPNKRTRSAGFVFTSSKPLALTYSGQDNTADPSGRNPSTSGYYETYLSLQNPKVIDWGGDYFQKDDGTTTDSVIAAAKAEGHDGVIIRNVNDPGGYADLMQHRGKVPEGRDVVGDLYVAFNPEQIKSAIGNNGQFDPNNPSILEQTTRGTFSPSTNTITLLQNADLSTFLHESGHFFLEALSDLAARPDAPAQVREDFDKLLAWFGIKGDETVGGPDAGGELGQSSKLTTDKTVYWHGSVSMDLRGGKDGLHLGTKLAATQALEARIGVPAEGAWDGTREYGKTLLAGRKTLERLEKERGYYLRTGLNAGGPNRPVPENDYYPTPGALTYADGTAVPMTMRPDIKPFRLKTEMSNSRSTPHEDFKANGYMRGALKKGNAKRGYYYINEGEDAGSVSVVVPNGDHVEPVSPDTLSQGGTPTTSDPVTPKRTPLETWRAMTLEQKRPHHERFAESFEQYLFEGRAPSVELRPVFRRFKEFLKRVYTGLKEFLAGRQNTPGGVAGAYGQGAGPIKTGEPVTLYYGRNTESSKKFKAPPGMDFGQALEPAGEYMNVERKPLHAPDARWEVGTISFKNPLVLEHNGTGSTGWKKTLSEMFGGKTGKALTKAVKAAGHDGVITHDAYGLNETVNLDGVKAPGGVAADSYAQGGSDFLKGEDGKPLVLYHGTETPGFDEFVPGGTSDSRQTGSTLGLGVYLSTDPKDGDIYAGKSGAVMPLHVRGKLLDLGNLTREQLQSMSDWANENLTPSDKARFEGPRKRVEFDDKNEALDFFKERKADWSHFDGITDRGKPKAMSEGGKFVVDYVDYSAPVKIENAADVETLLGTVGWNSVADFGYDGAAIPKGDGRKWVVMYKPAGNIKSAIGNNGQFDPNDPSILRQSVYHGTPHRGITQFSTDKIGTGEGAQAYGWGLYFASKREIAEWYREQLTGNALKVAPAEFLRVVRERMPPTSTVAKAATGANNLHVLGWNLGLRGGADQIKLGALSAVTEAASQSGVDLTDVYNPGQLYKVEIPEDSEMLLWDRPLSEQPEVVRKSAASLRGDISRSWLEDELDRVNAEWDELTGQDLYKLVQKALVDDALVPNTGSAAEDAQINGATDKAASLLLADDGIKGIKFLDGTSRSAGEGSYNYVVFSGDDTQIQEQYYQRNEKNPLGLTDEVRGVFDRMLASDEQIAEAEQLAGMLPDEDATAAAQEKLTARSLRDLKWARNAVSKRLKELQAEAKAVRREVRVGARRDVMADPVYRAWSFLTAKLRPEDRLPDGTKRKSDPNSVDPTQDSLLTAIAKLGGLDRDSAANELGVHADNFGHQSGVFGKPVFRKTNGRTADEMGQLLAEEGYLLPDESGRYDLRDLEDAIDAELRGSPQYSVAKDYSEADQRAGAGVDLSERTAGRLDLVGLHDVGATAEEIARLTELGMVAKNGGVHPDILSDAFNFEGGAELVRSLVNSESPRSAVEGLTDQRMLEEHGDLVDERAMREAALDAVHNAARARALATELSAQAAMLKAKGSTATTIAAAAKAFGENVVARTEVGKLKATAWKHTQAERRAAKAWNEATKKGDTQAAVQAKQDQVLQNAAARAAGEAQDEVQKIRDFFGRVAKGNNEKLVKGGRDPDIANAARAILAAYGMETATTKTAAEYLDAVKAHDPEMAGVIGPMVEAATRNAKDMDSLTVGEMQALRDEVESLWHLAKRSRQMEVDGNLMDIEDAEAELRVSIEAAGVPAHIPGEGGAITPREQLGRALQFAAAITRRVESWVEALDGKFGGPAMRLVYGPIKRAAETYRAERTAYRKELRALLDQVAPTMQRRLIEAPEIGYTFGKGHNGVGLNELLHAILHTGNDSNKRKLLLGRGWAAENADGALDTSKWDAFIKRMADTGVLQPAHYDFAQGVWDLLEKTKAKAQKAHRDVFGRYFNEVTANSFADPWGQERRGGYVPAQADARLSVDAQQRQLAEADNQSMAYAFPGTSKGFTKSRVEYNRPLMLDLHTIAQHIDKVVLFSNMEPAHNDVKRLLMRKGVSVPLSRAQPAAYEGMLIPWLSRSARQVVETPIVGDGRLSRVLSLLRARAGMALMFGNVSNTVQQITGFSSALLKVGKGPMLSATAEYLRGPKKMAERVANASPYMRDRMDNEIQQINGAMDEILLNPTVYQSAQAWTNKHAYFLQSAVDNVMGPIIWTGAYNEALAKGMTEQDAVHYADGTIRQTQGSTLPEDVSRIETGPAYARLFTQFMSYFNAMANTNATALQQVARELGLKRGAGRALGIVSAGVLVPLWVAEAIAVAFKGGPEDDDEDGAYLDDWIAAVLGLGTIKGLLAMVPFAGPAAQVAVNRFNTNPADDRMSLSPAVSMIESTVGAPASVYKALRDEGSAQKAVRDVLTAISMATGLPAFAVGRPAGYLAGVEEGGIAPTGPVDMARGLVTGVASPESKQ